MAICCVNSPALGSLIEAENYTDSYNLGGFSIQPVSFFLVGLDRAGEWTEYSYSASSFGTRSAVMLCRGYDALNYQLRLTLTPSGGGDAVTVDFEFTGAGCG